MKKLIVVALLAVVVTGTFSSCSNKLCPAYGNARRR